VFAQWEIQKRFLAIENGRDKIDKTEKK